MKKIERETQIPIFDEITTLKDRYPRRREQTKDVLEIQCKDNEKEIKLSGMH